MKKKRFEKIIIFNLIGTLLLGSHVSYSEVKAPDVKPQPLELTKAIEATLKADKELQNTFDKLTSKRLETETIKAQISKMVSEGGVTIKKIRDADLEKEKALHDLVESYAVVQSLDNEIVGLEIDVSKRSMDLRTDVKESYIEICLQESADAFFTKRVGILEPRLAQLNAKYLLGSISRDDVAKVKDELISAKESELRAKTLAEIQRAALAKLMGLETIDNYTLTYKTVPYVYDEKALGKAHDLAYANNLDLIKAIQEADYAMRDLDDLFEMAKLQYGGAVIPLVDLAKKSPVDYKLYFAQYSQLLSRPKKYEFEQYPLRLGLYRLDEKISLIKTSFKALEYTQKERYPIQYAVNTRDIRQTVVLNVKKQMEVEYGKIQSELLRMSDETLKKQEELKAEVAVSETLKKKNLLGKISYDTVVQNQETMEQLSYDLEQLALSIEKELVSLDQLTSGTLTGSSAGDNKPEIVKTPYWQIGPSNNQFGVTLNVKLPSSLKVSTYRLFDAKGTALSNVTDIRQSIFLMPINGGEDTTCTLEFYEKDKLVKRIKINSCLPKGSFEW